MNRILVAIAMVTAIACAPPPIAVISRIEKPSGAFRQCKVEIGWFAEQLVDECGAPDRVVPDANRPQWACAIYDRMNAEVDSRFRAMTVCLELDTTGLVYDSQRPKRKAIQARWIAPSPVDGFKSEGIRGVEWLRVKEAHGLTVDAVEAAHTSP